MKALKIGALALALGAPHTLAADCTAPEAPTLPDGASSTMEQMLEGKKAVNAFQAANLEFQQCLEPALNAAEAAVGNKEDGAADRFKALTDQYNAAVSAEEELVGQFNTEIREYKAANPS